MSRPASPGILPSRSRGTTSVARRLMTAARLNLVLIALVLATGWAGFVASSRSAAIVERITTAQAHHQDLDMDHDAIRSATTSGALAASQGDEAGVRRAVVELDELARAVDTQFTALGRSNLPGDLRERVTRARQDMTAYLALGGAVLDDAATVAAPVSVEHLSAFEASFDHLAAGLADITSRFAAEAAKARADASAARRQATFAMIAAAGVAAAITVVSAWQIRRSITRSLAQVATAAASVAAGDLDARSNSTDDDEIGQLGTEFNRVAESLQHMVGQLREDAERSAFGKELGSALEMVDTEREVYRVAQRAMGTAAGASPMELLLADSSQAHLEGAAVHPTHGGPGCGVESPFGCAAVRRGATVVFKSSAALDACPRFVDRTDSAQTAVCAPVSFMGRALGVLHAARPIDEPFSHEQIERIGTLATGIGTRIGTVRAFEKTQLQASTDGLTGLMNRRTMEEHLARLLEHDERFALAVADLDYFKGLNDTYGHHTGDRALGQFAEVLRTSTRGDDLVARWGGEEFTIAFVGLSAVDAQRVCERIREALALACPAANLPTFTASFGLVDSLSASTSAELFAIADRALYAAKDGGRNQAVIGPIADEPGAAAERHAVEHPAAMRPNVVG